MDKQGLLLIALYRIEGWLYIIIAVEALIYAHDEALIYACDETRV